MRYMRYSKATRKYPWLENIGLTAYPWLLTVGSITRSGLRKLREEKGVTYWAVDSRCNTTMIRDVAGWVRGDTAFIVKYRYEPRHTVDPGGSDMYCPGLPYEVPACYSLCIYKIRRGLRALHEYMLAAFGGVYRIRK